MWFKVFIFAPCASFHITDGTSFMAKDGDGTSFMAKDFIFVFLLFGIMGVVRPPLGQTGVAKPTPKALVVVSVTLILLLWGGQTIPRPAIGVARALLFFIFFQKVFFNVFNIFSF